MVGAGEMRPQPGLGSHAQLPWQAGRRRASAHSSWDGAAVKGDFGRSAPSPGLGMRRDGGQQVATVLPG